MRPEKLHKDAIILDELGILSHALGGFHSPSPFAQQNLFCILWGDIYTCKAPYEVHRRGLQAYILFRIIKGILYFDYEGKSFIAKDGDIIFINASESHHYYAKDEVIFQHFMFVGNCIEDYYKYLYSLYGVLYHDKSEASFLFRHIQNELESAAPNDHHISYLIHNILSILATHNNSQENPTIAKARKYILQHYQEDIQTIDIANHVSLSKYHFSRKFKIETGYTPSEYLFSVRMKAARQLLSETHASVENIAIACGFSSSSHFIRVFHKDSGITPNMFRKFFDPSGFRFY